MIYWEKQVRKSVMQVSFTGAPEYMDRSVGYGEASNHIYLLKINIKLVIHLGNLQSYFGDGQLL